MPTLLFAYGTLMPDGPAAVASDRWVADAVRGRLFDLGPYPALVDCEDPGAEWVEGFVRATTADELSERLDPYEGIDEGQYRRVAATTRAGRRVWVYVYARPLPRHSRGPLTRWDGRRGGPFKSRGPD
ncbi:MAG: gamma-glutamylcyclotransferase [Planctomycetaceae bacterium]|nr:gamma-glutamylcyclotransferase [Planctomycetaceae bacterium]